MRPPLQSVILVTEQAVTHETKAEIAPCTILDHRIKVENKKRNLRACTDTCSLSSMYSLVNSELLKKLEGIEHSYTLMKIIAQPVELLRYKGNHVY